MPRHSMTSPRLSPDDAVLCYVDPDSREAYFTTLPLDQQWGDDWNDAPYEHNAGTPYGPAESYSAYNRETGQWEKGSDYIGGKPAWMIIVVDFDAPLDMPCSDQLNSNYSVQGINEREIPWLRSSSFSDGEMVEIWAGTPLHEFLRVINRVGTLRGIADIYPDPDASIEA